MAAARNWVPFGSDSAGSKLLTGSSRFMSLYSMTHGHCWRKSCALRQIVKL